MIPLRPYQHDGLAALVATPHRRPLVAWATGLGKTVLFAHWLRDSAEKNGGGQAVILAHRDELLTQARSKLKDIWPEADVGLVKAEANEVDRQVVLASVQTVQRLERLRKLDRGRITHVVVDEAHHAAADSYQRVLAYLGSFSAEGPQTLGVTATPARSDSRDLLETWDDVIHKLTILDGIRLGFLCNLKAKTVVLDAFKLGDVRKRAGDYRDDDLERALLAAAGPEAIAQAVVEHAAGRRTLIFTPGVESARAAAVALATRGLRAEAVWGAQDLDERRAVLERFGDGTTEAVSNCAVLTEGYDNPAVSCVVIARPTLSAPFYTQMIGRGTRTAPGKEDCLILDLVGAARQHDLLTLASLMRDEGLELRDEESVVEALKRDEDDDRERKLEPIDLWATRPFAWVQTHFGWVLALGDAGLLFLVADASGWRVYHQPDRDAGWLRVWEGQSLGYAQGAAEDFCRGRGADKLAKRVASWRRDPASEAQKGMLQRWRLVPGVGMTKGEAADRLTRAIAEARWRRLGGR